MSESVRVREHAFRRHPGHAVLDAPSSGLRFIQPHTCKLGIGEDAERNQPVARCPAASTPKRPALLSPAGIDLYVAPLIPLDASILKSYTTCVRGASGRDEDVACVNRALSGLVADLYSDSFTGNDPGREPRYVSSVWLPSARGIRNVGVSA